MATKKAGGAGGEDRGVVRIVENARNRLAGPAARMVILTVTPYIVHNPLRLNFRFADDRPGPGANTSRPSSEWRVMPEAFVASEVRENSGMADVSDGRLWVCAVLIGSCDRVALESATASAALADLVGSGFRYHLVSLAGLQKGSD